MSFLYFCPTSSSNPASSPYSASLPPPCPPIIHVYIWSHTSQPTSIDIDAPSYLSSWWSYSSCTTLSSAWGSFSQFHSCPANTYSPGYFAFLTTIHSLVSTWAQDISPGLYHSRVTAAHDWGAHDLTIHMLLRLGPFTRGHGSYWSSMDLKIKTHLDDSIERYKARLVAHGFTQEYGIYYEETSAHVTKMTWLWFRFSCISVSVWMVPFLTGCEECPSYRSSGGGLLAAASSFAHPQHTSCFLWPQIGSMSLVWED